ncbi:MAG: helix-turn-helix transcriptional regulator [Nocardioides sp.]|nr:helix-turn-helix transcriptional regulator [Nocardioidaceae bacterium]MCB8958146.1 helix-turn-helix transcriptional regulator [Nocardioides sp.]
MDGSSPPVGVGLGPRNRIHEGDRQKVLDAAARLQIHRSELAAAVERGGRDDLVVGRGYDGVNRWIMTEIARWRELHSIRPAGTAAQLRVSLPHNRAHVARGLRMVSIFSADGLDAEARLLLANEPTGEYLLSVAPVQMKIVDRTSVLLDGPVLDGEVTLISVTAAPVVEAAWRYWNAAASCALPADDGLGRFSEITPRQHQVVALLASGANDDAIAAALEISVRTVRSDVAAILDALGVRTRFAAGMRLQLWSDGARS